VCIWPENINHPAFMAGIDLPKLAAAYKAITGRDFPVKVGPAPTPPPTPPTPSPAPPWWRGLLDLFLALFQTKGSSS
jgi:hypothetical protein